MTVLVVDVSGNNGSIDWPQVAAAGVQIAIAKCSQGASSDYPSFPRNWLGIRAAGIPRRGAYHYADARSTPTANATAAATALARNGGMTRDDFLGLDTERLSKTTPWPLAPGEPTIDWTLETLAAMEQLTGRVPWLYCSLGWLSGMLRADARLRPYPLWVADINAGPITTPWPYALRQFTWTAHVPGIGGAVDGSELGPAYPHAPQPPPGPKPVPPSPPVTRDLGDAPMKWTDIDTPPLDAHGAGEIAIPGIPWADIGGTTLLLHATEDPLTIHQYLPIPRHALVRAGTAARVVFEGGRPGGTYAVRVEHV